MKSYPWPALWEAFLPAARLADTSSRYHEITESENVCVCVFSRRGSRRSPRAARRKASRHRGGRRLATRCRGGRLAHRPRCRRSRLAPRCRRGGGLLAGGLSLQMSPGQRHLSLQSSGCLAFPPRHHGPARKSIPYVMLAFFLQRSLRVPPESFNLLVRLRRFCPVLVEAAPVKPEDCSPSLRRLGVFLVLLR